MTPTLLRNFMQYLQHSIKPILLKTLFVLSLVFISSLSFAKDIDVVSPYIREVPPGVTTSAAFLTLKNNTDKASSLVKVSSYAAKNIELHEHTHKDGMMEMRQVEKIIIPAQGETTLKPGGYHIMLIALTRKIKSGDKVTLELEFDNGDKQQIEAEVKRIMQGMQGMKK